VEDFQTYGFTIGAFRGPIAVVGFYYYYYYYFRISWNSFVLDEWLLLTRSLGLPNVGEFCSVRSFGSGVVCPRGNGGDNSDSGGAGARRKGPRDGAGRIDPQ